MLYNWKLSTISVVYFINFNSIQLICNVKLITLIFILHVRKQNEKQSNITPSEQTLIGKSLKQRQN
jgi:hypothetical protein